VLDDEKVAVDSLSSGATERGAKANRICFGKKVPRIGDLRGTKERALGFE
jgi:hypothetical protein